jgi:hypothetical protein
MNGDVAAFNTSVEAKQAIEKYAASIVDWHELVSTTYP